MSDSNIMFGLLTFMILTALIIPVMQRDFTNSPTQIYNLNGTIEDLEQIDQDNVFSSDTSISIFESFFNMFFWVYSGMGIIFNGVIIIVRLMFWFLIAKLVRGTG